MKQGAKNNYKSSKPQKMTKNILGRLIEPVVNLFVDFLYPPIANQNIQPKDIKDIKDIVISPAADDTAVECMIPDEIWFKIAEELATFTDFFRLQQVSKRFYHMQYNTMHSTDTLRAIDNIPLDWGKNDQGNIKTKAIRFQEECERISQSYPEYIARDIGGIEFLAAIPLLGEKPLSYVIDIFGKVEYNKKKAHKPGIYPRIALFAKNIKTDEIKKYDFGISQAEVYPPIIYWGFQSGELFPEVPANALLPDEPVDRREYLIRLVNNHPCGEVVDGKEVAPKESKGKPLMQLCDETGNLLNLCTKAKRYKP